MKKLNSIVIVIGVFIASQCEAQISGVCRFDTDVMSFEGTSQESAKCLLRPVQIRADLGPNLVDLPPKLNSLIGNSADLPRAKIRDYLAKSGISETEIGGDLNQKLSHNSEEVSARFFVIHDTSSPNFGVRDDFPTDIDQSARVNNLVNYDGSNAVAHLFINRGGKLLTGHPLSQGWRATKLETKIVGPLARGLFIHVELIQPRRSNRLGREGNDQIAPTPGFTESQYKGLALAYIVASVRAGKWLVPGFHAVIDSGISDGHDDPQNFDLLYFDKTLGEVIDAIKALAL